MAKISREQALNRIQDVWVVDLRESELGSGSDCWSEFYTTYKEANDRYTEVNAENPAGPAPDYYVTASKPRRPTLT